MKKLSRVLVAVALTGACSAGGWPEEERVAFMDNCERTSGGQTSLCECMLDKVEDRYPDVDDADSLSIGEITEMQADCQ